MAGLYRVVPSLAVFHCVLLGFTEFYLIWKRYLVCLTVLPSFAVLSCFRRFDNVALGFTGFYLVSVGVLPSWNEFSLDLIGSSGSVQVVFH